MKEKLSQTAIAQLITLARELAGVAELNDIQKDQIIVWTQNKITELNKINFLDFLHLLKDDQTLFIEFKIFLKKLVKTDQWFQMKDCFTAFEGSFIELISKVRGLDSIEMAIIQPDSIKEVYSWIMFIKTIFTINNSTSLFEKVIFNIYNFNFEIDSYFPIDDLNQIPKEYQTHILRGHQSFQNLFIVDQKITKKCHWNKDFSEKIFKRSSVSNSYSASTSRLNTNTNSRLYEILKSNAKLIILGGLFNSEGFDDLDNSFSFKSEIDHDILILSLNEINKWPKRWSSKNKHAAQSQFTAEVRGNHKLTQLTETPSHSLTTLKASSSKIKTALVVEDVPVFRLHLVNQLKSLGFQVEGTSSAEMADEMIKKRSFDMITLDLGLPGESGAHWLNRIRARGYTGVVVIVSSSDPREAKEVLGALVDGAQHYFVKDDISTHLEYFKETINALVDKSKFKEYQIKQSLPNIKKPDLILVGASTGGPQALFELLSNLPDYFPPLFVVQHTSSFLIDQFAQSLSVRAGLRLSEMKDHEVLEKGVLYTARGEYHIQVSKNQNGQLILNKNYGAKVHGHSPAVDPLFLSASSFDISILSILLTGMGKDGAQGMLELSKSPHHLNMVQSADSCVVFGMPRAALELGAVNFVGNIQELRHKMNQLVSGSSLKSVS